MVQGRWTDGKRRVAARGWEVGRTRAILRGGSIDRGEERMPAGGSRAVAFPEEGRGWGRRFWGKGDGCGRSHAGRPDSGCLGQGLAGLLGRVDSIWTRGDEGATRIPDYSVNSRTLPPRPQCSLSRQRCSLNLKKKPLSFYLHCIKAGCDVRRVCVTSTRACQPKRRAKFCLSQEGATV